MTKKPFTATLGYQVVQLCKAHRQKAEALLSTVGLHAGQEFILMHLWNNDGCMQGELVDEICVQPATITKSLDRLEAAGFVERRPDDEDRRVSRVYLTAQGRALQLQVDALWHELETATFGDFDNTDRETFRRLAARARKNVTQ